MPAVKSAISLLLFLAGSTLAGQSLPEWRAALKAPLDQPVWRAPAWPDLQPMTPPHRIPSLYDYRELAPFCKLDVKLENTFKLPVKFRLGEVQYVDRLEQKGPTTVPSFP